MHWFAGRHLVCRLRWFLLTFSDGGIGDRRNEPEPFAGSIVRNRRKWRKPAVTGGCNCAYPVKLMALIREQPPIMIFIFQTHLDVMRKSFRYRAPLYWSLIDKNLQVADNVKNFKFS